MHKYPKEDFYGEHAECWDMHDTRDPRKISHVVDLLELKGGEDILDVGTGTGVLIPFYERHCPAHVKAIDISEKMISIAREKYPKDIHNNVDFVVQDLYDLDERPVYDRVVCYSCFPHFRDQSTAIVILASILKDGGILAILHSESREYIRSMHESRGEAVPHDALPDLDVIEKMFIDAGLYVVLKRDDEEYYVVIGRKGSETKSGLTKDEMYALLLKEYTEFKDEGRDVYFDQIINDYRKDMSSD
jgi:cyclopropane fatty-acyl-phospholipid synthase-like methyltransferase